MSKSGGGGTVFQGQLFQGEEKSKKWALVCSGQVGVALQHAGGGEWWLVASKGKEKVWEGRLDPSFKHRVRDTFVQWQHRGKEGATKTYGLRLKETAIAKQFSDAIVSVLGASSSRSKTAEGEDVVLRILLPGKESTSLTVPKSAPVSHVLKLISQQRRQFDPAQHALALPPDSPQGQSTLCPGSMTVGALRSTEVHLVRRSTSHLGGAAGNSTSDQMLLLNVDLPKGERTVVRVDPSQVMPDLLKYICEKRNLDPWEYRFDLPVTEESLVWKTLEQLKINTLKVVPREGKQTTSQKGKPPAAKDKANEKPTEGSGSGTLSRRMAPPPPPQRRRTQPELMKELAVEVAARKQSLQQEGWEGGEGESGEREEEEAVNREVEGGGSEEVDVGPEEGRGGVAGEPQLEPRKQPPPPPPTHTSKRNKEDGNAPTLRKELKPRTRPAPPPPTKTAVSEGPVGVPDSAPLDSLPGSRGPPPPVAEKPHKRRTDTDEADTGLAAESFSREALDLLVSEVGSAMGEKRKKGLDRADADVITEGLKKQAASQGRYLSIKKKKQEGEGARMGQTDSVKRNQRLETVGKQSSMEERLKGREETDGDAKQQFVRMTPHEAMSLKRRPKGPAPPPPRTRSQTTEDIPSPKSRVAEYSSTMSLRRPKVTPVRRAPVRPAPHSPKTLRERKPETKLAETQVAERAKAEVGVETETKPLPLPAIPEGQANVQPLTSETKPLPQENSPAIPEGQRNVQPLTSTPTRRVSATTTIRETGDGRIMLIVTPSPQSVRKFSHPAQVIFNLPPPPPLELEPKEPKREVESKQASAEQKQVQKPELVENAPASTEEDGNKLEAEESTLTTILQDPLSPAKSEVVSPGAKTAETSILSNEYTNLDDLLSGSEDTLNDLVPKESQGEYKDTAPTSAGPRSEPDKDTSAHDSGKEESEDDCSSDTSSEGEFDVATQDRKKSSASDSNSECGYDFVEASPLHQTDLALPPPMPDIPNVSLNTNCNNNEEIVDSALPPPPIEFVMPTEVTFDGECGSDSDSDSGEGEGGIVLISMTTHHEDAPVIPEELDKSSKLAEKNTSKEKEGNKPKELSSPTLSTLKDSHSVSSSLEELDSMVSSLQKLIVDTTGTPPSTPPRLRQSSPLPFGIPPPPPFNPQPTPLSNTIPPKPRPPPTKPKPVKQPDGDAAKDELTEKLKQRQRALKAQAEAEANPLQSSLQPASPNSVPVSDQTTSPHSRTSTTQSPGDNVQMQLQFLQQQVMQQQMMQLQQQFHQLQQIALQQNVGMMMPGMNQPLLQPAISNPALLGMATQQAVPFTQTSMIAATSAQGLPMAGAVIPHPQPHSIAAANLVPQQTIPATYVVPSMPVAPTVLAAASLPPSSTPIHSPPNPAGAPSTYVVPSMPVAPTVLAAASLPPPSTPIHSPPNPAGAPPTAILRDPPPNTTTMNGAAKWRRKRSEEVRSMILGELEDQFDSLMEEVRDADPSLVLKKVPEEDRENSSSYTGMAAALAEALKQRRMHFTEKQRLSTSADFDDSHAEWESP